MSEKTTVKVIRQVPAKKATLLVACSTCSHHDLETVEVDRGQDVCTVHGACAVLEDPSHWRCDQWNPSEEAMTSIIHNG